MKADTPSLPTELPLCGVLAIGDELLDGTVQDTNGPWVGERLMELGFAVVERRCVGDHAVRILEGLKELTARCSVVFVSGGLGSTSDDITAEVAAGFFGRGRSLHAPSAARIRKKLESLGRRVSPRDLEPARVPHGAAVLANPVGVAPGFHLAQAGTHLFFMPGVPEEMRKMFHLSVVPKLAQLGIGGRSRARRYFRITGMGESTLEERMKDLMDGSLSPHYLPQLYGVDLILEGDDADGLDDVAQELQRRLGWRMFAQEPLELAQVVGRELSAKRQTLATAESCTGGLVGHLITEIPGSSAYFKLGAVVYSNEAKVALLGVGEDTLETHGAVSGATVEEMAQGVCKRSGADFGVAVSGVAGPGGGTQDKPVGTVWFALKGPEGVEVERRHILGDRGQIKLRAAYWALTMLHRNLTGDR